MKKLFTIFLLLLSFASFSQNVMRNDLSATDKNTLINYNSAIDGQGFIVGGNSNIADSQGYIYFYVASSTATPDGNLILPATGMGIGRFIKCETSQTVSLTSGRGISITGTSPNFTISLVTPTITIRNTANSNARTLNSNFTVSSTKEALVTYTVTCSVTNPLLVGTSSASAFLEYSTDGGTTWQLPAQNGNTSGVGVTVTLQLTNGQTGTLTAMIPANALTRIRTTTSGTGSVTYVTGQEIVY